MKKPTCLILTGIGVLLLVVVLIFAVPWFMNVYEEVQQMGDKQAVHKRELREFANKPLTNEQEVLLKQLNEIAGETSNNQSGENLELVLSSSSYLSYIESHESLTFEDYSTYLAAMPTSKHRSVALSRLMGLIGIEVKPEEQEIWMEFYYLMREWSKSGKNVQDNQKEFKELLQTHLVNPLMEKAGMGGFSTKFVQMGLISTFIVEDNRVFHSAWQSRIRSFGKQEGYLRCAIATPIDFALMRSFFDDAPTFEEWLSEPFIKVLEPADADEGQQ